jgi:uncharacterized phage protein (TIGR01671 family)
MREIKFRAWDGRKMNYNPFISDGSDGGETSSVYINVAIACNDEELMQYTGLKDKNGKEIYEGDIIRFRQPYRSTQTHTGDNIPNGSYTEPMEAEIKTKECEVIFKDGMFVLKDEDENFDTALVWADVQWDEEGIRDAVSVELNGKNFFDWDKEEEGDLQYLLETYKLNDVNELIKYVSGVEVIGNSFENPELQA